MNIKALDGWKLEVLGCPYFGPVGGKDLQGDFFSERTDFMLASPDQTFPVCYMHGAHQHQPEVIGVAKVLRRDNKGLWFEVMLKKASSLARRVWEAAKNGLARASSGSLSHLVRRAGDGELLSWPVGELTILDLVPGQKPVNAYAVATPMLKAHYKAAGIVIPQHIISADLLDEVLEEIL